MRSCAASRRCSSSRKGRCSLSRCRRAMHTQRLPALRGHRRRGRRSHAAREPGGESRRRCTKGASDHASRGRRRSSARFSIGPRRISRTRLASRPATGASCRTTTSRTTRVSTDATRTRGRCCCGWRSARTVRRRARTQPIAATFTGVPGEVFAAVTVSRVDRWLAETTRRGFPASRIRSP